jgi:tRNA pseudouridine38-40 synthase
MPRFKLTLEYHGGPFVGWQRQENGPSVQGAVEAALAGLGEPATATGAGRTDAGVHARGQVAHVDLSRDWEPFRLGEALNHHLRPGPVAVLAVERVPDEFHARFGAVRRHYLYRIICRRAPLTLEAGLAWRVGYPLDPDAMRAAAAPLIGRHDFTTFRAAQCQAASPVKTLDAIEIDAQGDTISFRLHARSFLHNQVRSLVGTLERVGAGRWPAGQVAEALAARDRAACGPVAPPDGLYLMRVDYPG